ncbi:unnamed protein product [Cladocopium goreaui]|uniref:Uncharacterized protein n=1 Tax=Cladocopium goreaui TaxID=2562237 RepID=A0A9P1DGK9_9DINO|nr:unnamed protein product [Cladocopium goreaui]
MAHVRIRQELQQECQERKAQGSQLSSQLLEHAERLEWAEQQRMKAESALLQDLREAKTELKREIRDREEGQSQAKMGGSGENHMGDFPLPA